MPLTPYPFAEAYLEGANKETNQDKKRRLLRVHQSRKKSKLKAKCVSGP